MHHYEDLGRRWRERADDLRRYGATEGIAAIWELAAEEWEAEYRAALMEPLDLRRAEEESGYTRSHLRRMLNEKKISNSGTRERPQIRREHLPRKPGHGVALQTSSVALSKMQVARAVATGE